MAWTSPEVFVLLEPSSGGTAGAGLCVPATMPLINAVCQGLGQEQLQKPGQALSSSCPLAPSLSASLPLLASGNCFGRGSGAGQLEGFRAGSPLGCAAVSAELAGRDEVSDPVSLA